MAPPALAPGKPSSSRSTPRALTLHPSHPLASQGRAPCAAAHP